MNSPFSTALDFSSIKSALPYIKQFKGSTFVAKLGGEICDDSSSLENSLEQLSILHNLGIKIVIVHGAGKQASDLAKKLNVDSKFVAGRRVTSKEMIEVAQMTFAGKVNTTLVANLKKFGVSPVGLSGLDASLTKSAKRNPIEVFDEQQNKEIIVDYGYVANIESTNCEIIELLLCNNYIPVICSLSDDGNGQILNINADTLATHIAYNLKAQKLLYLGSTDGILFDVNNPNSLISILRLPEAKQLLESPGIKAGMIPKLSNAILTEVFTNEGSGTMIMP